MKTVWKFPISITDGTLVVTMPRDAQIVDVDSQNGMLCTWAIVDEHAPAAARRFRVVGTGREMPADGQYVGTAHMPPFVWHLFEVPL